MVPWRALRISALAACISCRREPPAPPLFELVPPSESGVTFTNALPEDSAFNILNYLYYYNGGGVAVGDVNNDGLVDLYFTANLGANRLYLNKGNYRFEDVTARAGVADSVGWKTGVTMADVDGDGWVDIYVSGIADRAFHGRNVLYVNNHDGTFTDRTKEFGLDFVGYGTQAAFFDYDVDGDLDVYLLNYSTHGERGVASARSRNTPNPRAGDRLLRNDRGHFTDVTASAGIYSSADGFGLGVVVSDLFRKECQDIYVANDFQENDYLYVNRCDGRFTEAVGGGELGHTSQFSMGVDAADFDNDGWPDVVTLDMLPDRDSILKTSASVDSYRLSALRQQAGYQPQFSRNMLHLNRRRGFSEIGVFAGIHATDWSWAPLFGDVDNDGYKDLFITSGIYRRPNDLDYIRLVETPAMQAALARGGREVAALSRQLPHVPLPNRLFRNNRDSTFSERAVVWGLREIGFSNGAVYADLNNSGALDLVVNRINAPALIYRNTKPGTNHFLRVVLQGDSANTAGIGAKVFVHAGGTTQLVEQMPTRGYLSSVDPRLHFGLGSASNIDSLLVIWPGQRSQALKNVPVDREIVLRQSDASEVRVFESLVKQRSSFTDVTATTGIAFKHTENAFVDFDREPLMPHLLSTEGPALAVGDVNGDGLDDVFVGGARGQAGALFMQQPDGAFRRSDQPATRADSLAEDVDATFIDVNGDGSPDLYVVSGGNEFAGEDAALQDRLYLNDGRGNLRRDTTALPTFAESGGCVVAGDFDRDGDVDLFVGRRVVAGRYGVSPRGYLLENDGRGHFRDVTAERAPGLVEPGMVSSAAWVDYDADGALDLVVTGEWMPVRVFHQERGRFVERTADVGLAGSQGWWNTVMAADLDGDKRPDLVLGNLGLNSYLRASKDAPARLYVGDFASRGSVQQLLTFYKDGVRSVLAGRDEILGAIPNLRAKFPTYASFGRATLADIVPESELSRARVLEARTFATSVAWNEGGRFVLQPLPTDAQLSPTYVSLADDFDGDGRVDLLLGGNFYGVQPILGRYDASHGTLLLGAGNRRFTVDTRRRAALLEGQVRRARLLRGRGNRRLIVVARNNETVQVLRP